MEGQHATFKTFVAAAGPHYRGLCLIVETSESMRDSLALPNNSRSERRDVQACGP
jgi:hypothetical protein